MYLNYCRRIVQKQCCEEGLLDESLLFKCCQLLQNFIGNMQVALPGWWAKNLSCANKNVVSTQAETFRVCIFVIGEGGRRGNLFQRPPTRKSVYPISNLYSVDPCQGHWEAYRMMPSAPIVLSPGQILASLPQELTSHLLHWSHCSYQ